jgi:hypothetical protein
MPGLVVFKLNSKNIAEVLKSSRVEQECLRLAKQGAAQANGAAGLTDGFIAGSEIGPNRARAYVVTATAEAMVAEAKDRTLTRAFDALRGQ